MSNEAPISTFHLFPDLPSEIRLKIWHFAAPPATVVTILHVPSYKQVPYPALLAVCRETRSEFLDSGETSNKKIPGLYSSRYTACRIGEMPGFFFRLDIDILSVPFLCRGPKPSCRVDFSIPPCFATICHPSRIENNSKVFDHELEGVEILKKLRYIALNFSYYFHTVQTHHVMYISRMLPKLEALVVCRDQTTANGRSFFSIRKAEDILTALRDRDKTFRPDITPTRETKDQHSQIHASWDAGIEATKIIYPDWCPPHVEVLCYPHT